MISRLTQNLTWKLLSVFFSVLIWLMFINFEDPQESKTFRNIEVIKINEDAITSQRQAIEYLGGDKVDLKVKGRRSVIDNLSASDIVAIADLERTSITGAVDIQIQTKADIQVIEKTPSTLLVRLERVLTKQKEVQYYKEGEVAKGYIALEPIIVPSRIDIEGPESKIAKVKSVLVPIVISGASKDINLYSKPEILDENNKEILGISTNLQNVSIYVPIQKLKTVPINISTSGQVEDGYELVSVSLDKETVDLRGKELEINKIKEITLKDIDLTGKKETEIIEIILEDFLPTPIFLNQEKKIYEVKLEIEKIIEKEFKLDINSIEQRNKKANYIVDYLGNNKVFTVKYKGRESLINNLKEEDLEASINLLGLNPGYNKVSLDFGPIRNVELISPPMEINIEIIDTNSPKASGDR